MQQATEALNHPYFGVFVLLVFTFWVFNLTLRIQRFLSRKMAQKKGRKAQARSL